MRLLTNIAEVHFPLKEGQNKEAKGYQGARKVHFQDNGHGLLRLCFEEQNEKKGGPIRDIDYISFDLDGTRPQFAGIYVESAQRGKGVADVMLETALRILEEIKQAPGERTSRIRKPNIALFLQKWAFSPHTGGAQIQIQAYTPQGVPIIRSTSFLPEPRYPNWYILEDGPFQRNPALKTVTLDAPYRLREPDLEKHRKKRAAVSQDVSLKLRNMKSVKEVVEEIRKVRRFGS